MFKSSTLLVVLVILSPWYADEPRRCLGSVLYVDASATGADDGSSWCDALVFLQDALDEAIASGGAVTDIHVAQGTYKPDRGVSQALGDREATFQLINGTSLRGGFAGCGEPDPDLRDNDLYKSILSGDLSGDDSAFACNRNTPDCDSLGQHCADGFCIIRQGNTENCYHVVTGSGTDPTTLLDGFIISDGNANGPNPDNLGGGMYNELGSSTVTNCTFSDNSASGSGGGMANLEDSSPIVTNCTFSGNTVPLSSFDDGGGGMYNDNSNPTVSGCTFIGNVAADGGGMFNNDGSSPGVTNCFFFSNRWNGVSSPGAGGGMFNLASSPTVTHCTFQENSNGAGGGMHNTLSNPTVTDCAFINNVALGCGGGMENAASSPRVTNCIFRGNSAVVFGGGMGNFGILFGGIDATSDPTLTNCTFSGNTSRVGGGISNERSSPVITNSIFAQNGAIGGGGMFNRISSSPTIINCTFRGNSASGEGGGILHASGNSVVINSVFWQNSDLGGVDESGQIHVTAGTLAVSYSNLQGGWTGVGGTGNIDADPLFVDPDGPDNIPGNDDDNLRLRSGSPCIDAGDNSVVTVSPDLDGNQRIVDDPVSVDCPQAPGTCGVPPIVDMGAYEFGSIPCVLADLDCDGDVDLRDFSTFQRCFDAVDPLACNPTVTPDLSNNGEVDLDDYSLLHANLSGPAFR